MTDEEDGKMEYIKTRSELATADCDWERSWRRARLRGLGSKASSFLWKLLHDILPTEQRLNRILPNSSEVCKLCPNQVVADQTHSLFKCVNTRGVGEWLLVMVKKLDPTVTPSRLIRLEFESDESTEMPMVWIIAQTLLYLWGVRADGKIASLILTRAELESKISLLRETRYHNEYNLMKEMLEANL